MDVVMSFAWVGVMLLIGMLLRAFVKPLGDILMPACVIAGLIGFVFLNFVGPDTEAALGVSADGCGSIVGTFFTFTFISMGLTNVPKADGVNSGKEVFKGSVGMGCVWNILYTIQPFVGYGLLLVIGGMFSMAPEYGLTIPFGFDHGPGQAATFGALMEKNGLVDAQQVALTFAVIGFLLAFGVGVPIAKYGLKKGLACYPKEIDKAIKVGVYKKEEQKEVAGMTTTYNGNIDSLAFCAALVGLCYVICMPIGDALMATDNQFLQIFGSMQFFIGMVVAWIVRFLMNKLNIKQYHDDGLQTRITGFTTDFMITAAFMSIQLSVVGKWLVPIIILSLAAGLVTFVVCLFFASRIGGYFDFERFLGLWGTATGTCPSGIALIRIVDPELKTTAASEMGSMNTVMMVDAILVPLLISYADHGISFATIALWFFGIAFGSLMLSVLTGNVKRKATFNLFKGEKYIKNLENN